MILVFLLLAGARKIFRVSQPLTKAYEEAVSAAFRPTTMRTEVLTHLRASLGERDMKDILAWLKSATGRKVLRAEEQASRQATLDNIEKSRPFLARAVEQQNLLVSLQDRRRGRVQVE